MGTRRMELKIVPHAIFDKCSAGDWWHASPMMSAAIFALAASVSLVGVVQQFQTIEQSLMNAITAGDRAPWERVMDADCVPTTEEGEVLTREAFLKDLRPLPPGLSGAIAVRDLTVQERSDVAVVRFLADESERCSASDWRRSIASPTRSAAAGRPGR